MSCPPGRRRGARGAPVETSLGMRSRARCCWRWGWVSLPRGRCMSARRPPRWPRSEALECRPWLALPGAFSESPEGAAADRESRRDSSRVPCPCSGFRTLGFRNRLAGCGVARGAKENIAPPHLQVFLMSRRISMGEVAFRPCGLRLSRPRCFAHRPSAFGLAPPAIQSNRLASCLDEGCAAACS